ncbi:MAG: hypothetical protein HKN91_11995 [Acidimicrobiia bacterium]|nr:hypothetical protein [Acidimicrobiia bacterium]
MDDRAKHAATITGGALLVIGSLMTWISVDVGFQAFSSTGTETAEGKLTLAAGIVLIGVGALLLSGIAAHSAIAYAGAAAAVFGAVVLALEYMDVRARIADADGTGATATIGAGVWIAAVGVLLALAATGWTVLEKRNAAV